MADLGRSFLLKKNGVTFAGVRSKSLSINNDPVDVTSDEDGGYRTLLDTPGQVALDITFSGIEKDTVMRDLGLISPLSQQFTDITLEWSNGDTISGTFNLGPIDISGDYNESITFSSSLQSSGEWTYTDAP